MTRIELSPLGLTVEAAPGETLLQALRRAGVDLESPCDGLGVCGRCAVRVEEGARVAPTPHRNLSPEDGAAGVRLACLVTPGADLTVHLLRGFVWDARVLEGERLSAARVAPAARVRADGAGFQLEYDGEAPLPLAGWREGLDPLGLAVDLGTTTLVVSVFSLATGEELATASALNPQTRFGHDVLSRIHKGSTPGGLAELHGTVAAALNRLAAEACGRAGVAAGQVVDVVVGGNPTMLQLAAGVDPAPLGRVPFPVGMASGCSYPAERFGLTAHPAARVYVPPVAHAFVGSDISAGLLAAEFFERPGPVLFLDIGTNGELALGAGGRWWVTSAAAGPAFEGMGVSHGMRAAPGAIEAVTTDGAEVETRVIGGVAATGICGSGILDAAAVLARVGAVDRGGRMRKPGEAAGLPPAVAARLELVGGRPAFRLADGGRFTQHDVRQVQLGKGALRTAADLLLEAAGVTPGELRQVILAGAFGYHLRPESLEALGLLPPGLLDRVLFAGNTSRTGAALLLLDGGRRRELEARMARVEHVALADHPAFQERFVANLGFPEPALAGPRP
ncbi:MAG: ASKHA domain-containing protein [Deferrisomatales bacterium]